MAKPFTLLTGLAQSKTLIGKLQPTADRLRDLTTRFGLRPYVVRLVRTAWTGGARGFGSEYVVGELTLLPVPKVSEIGAMERAMLEPGLAEQGSIRVSRISADRYTENDLKGYDAAGNPPGPEEQFFYEIEFATKTGAGVLRRFQLVGVPEYKPGRLCWNVTLARSHDDREANGDLGGSVMELS